MENVISLICQVFNVKDRKRVELRYSELNGWDFVIGADHNSYIMHNDGFWTLDKLQDKVKALMPAPSLLERIDYALSGFISTTTRELLLEVRKELTKE